MVIDINCDLGEYDVSGVPENDSAIMPFITSANIACGLHAGNPAIIDRTVQLAIEHDTGIGAHPGYPDREGFGRRSLQLSYDELRASLIYQIGAVKTIAEAYGTVLRHVKPHGALYNEASLDYNKAILIAHTIMEMDPALILVGLAGSQLLKAAGVIGLPCASEVFADRAYDDDGKLLSRDRPDAVLHDTEVVIDRALMMIRNKIVESVSGKIIPIAADTICIHGDNEMAPVFAKKLSEALVAEGIKLKRMGER
jgi:UPF0271 protein